MDPIIHYFDGTNAAAPCGDNDEESFVTTKINEVTCQGCLAILLRDYKPSTKKPVLH